MVMYAHGANSQRLVQFMYTRSMSPYLVLKLHGLDLWVQNCIEYILLFLSGNLNKIN